MPVSAFMPNAGQLGALNSSYSESQDTKQFPLPTGGLGVLPTAARSQGHLWVQPPARFQQLLQLFNPRPCCYIILSTMDDKRGW